MGWPGLVLPGWGTVSGVGGTGAFPRGGLRVFTDAAQGPPAYLAYLSHIPRICIPKTPLFGVLKFFSTREDYKRYARYERYAKSGKLTGLRGVKICIPACIPCVLTPPRYARTGSGSPKICIPCIPRFRVFHTFFPQGMQPSRAALAAPSRTGIRAVWPGVGPPSGPPFSSGSSRSSMPSRSHRSKAF